MNETDKKIRVPEYVAQWIEEAKWESKYNGEIFMVRLFNYEEMPSEVTVWLCYQSNDKRLAEAALYGYETV